MIALSACRPHTETVVLSQPAKGARLDTTALQTRREMMGEDAAESMMELIDCYLAETPKLLQAIRDAIAHDDVKALNHASHALKSSSASLGAMMLADLCQVLEVDSRKGLIQNGTEKIQQLESEYVQVKVALQQELRG